MGTKFANLHIQTENLDEVIDIIKKLKMSSSYYVGAFGRWISVYGDSYDWGTIGTEAQVISQLLKYPVLSVGYFDDDIVEMGLYQHNHLITKHVTGFGVDVYGLEFVEMDKQSFEQILNLGLDTKELASILKNEDPSELVEGMETILDLPLWMKYEWIEDDDEIKEQFILVK